MSANKLTLAREETDAAFQDMKWAFNDGNATLRHVAHALTMLLAEVRAAEGEKSTDSGACP